MGNREDFGKKIVARVGVSGWACILPVCPFFPALFILRQYVIRYQSPPTPSQTVTNIGFSFAEIEVKTPILVWHARWCHFFSCLKT